MTANEGIFSGAENEFDEFCGSYFAYDADVEENHIPIH